MAKLPEERFSDGKRIRLIIQSITELFNGSDLEDLSIDTKVTLSFQHDRYPIYRRFTKQPFKVEGYWWTDEHNTLQYGWNGYADAKLIDYNGVNRIWLTRSFLPGWVYIRHSGDWVDIEAMSMTTLRTKTKKKAVREWVTCSVPLNFYQNVLDSFLEPIHDVCTKHKYGAIDGEEEGHG